MNKLSTLLFAFGLFIKLESLAVELPGEDFLAMPAIGAHGLRILAPDLVQLTLITTKEANDSQVVQWNFVKKDSQFRPPALTEFAVTAGQKNIAVDKVGFKRRPIYAPLKKRDLRIGNYLYLHLAEPISETEVVEVKNPSGKLWSPQNKFVLKNDPAR